MTGFQIPGLGQARPNEKLPPLSTDALAAPTPDVSEAKTGAKSEFASVQEGEPDLHASNEMHTAQKHGLSETLHKDQPESPSSLPRALEAEVKPASAGELDSEPRRVIETDTTQRDLAPKSMHIDQSDSFCPLTMSLEAEVEPASAGEMKSESKNISETDIPEQSLAAESMLIDRPESPAPLAVSLDAEAEAASAGEMKSEPSNLDEIDTAPKDLGPDSMHIDQPQNRPSLTSALEAAIGGLGNQADAPEQNQTWTGEAQAQNDQSENPEWELDSSPYESSSDPSSSSSDSDSSDLDSDNGAYKLLGAEETARLLMETEGGSDDEGERNKGSSAAQLRTKNEIAQEVQPRPDITITEEMKIEELGSVENIVENIVLVKAITPGEYQVLDTGSILCNAERTVIGVVAETFGKVLQPMYTVYFRSAEEVKDVGLELGAKIFYPVDHASYVFTQPLKNLKGSDASNLHDEEVGDDEMEFSDDEKEAEYKRALKQKKKDRWKGRNDGKTLTDEKPHPLRQEISGLNYDDGGDDDDDGPYKPLSRPPGFGDGPVSTEPSEAARRSGFRRGGGGRGRGSGRGGGGLGAGRGGQTRAASSPAPPQSYPAQSQSQSQPQTSSQMRPHQPHVLPGFGFQVAGWPQAPGQGQTIVPPPPPPPPPPPAGWQGPAGAPNTFINPAIVAALMSQMQQQGGQAPWDAQFQGGRGQ